MATGHLVTNLKLALLGYIDLCHLQDTRLKFITGSDLVTLDTAIHHDVVTACFVVLKELAKQLHRLLLGNPILLNIHC